MHIRIRNELGSHFSTFPTSRSIRLATLEALLANLAPLSTAIAPPCTTFAAPATPPSAIFYFIGRSPFSSDFIFLNSCLCIS